MKEDLTYRLLDELLHLYLHEQHSAPIPSWIAELVELKFQNRQMFHIEWRGGQRPLIWYYKNWADSVERDRRAKERSERERVARFIEEANIKIVAAELQKQYHMEEKFAKSTAFGVVSKGKWMVIKSLGLVGKLIEREDQL